MRSIESNNDLNNPKICCPRSCGSYCNECNGNGALQPQYCSAHKGNMCFQGEDKRSCCATTIKPDRICYNGILEQINVPCRLRKQHQIIVYKAFRNYIIIFMNEFFLLYLLLNSAM